MDTHVNVKRRFLPLLDRHEPIIQDSSAITTWKTCPRLYFYKYVLARVTKDQKPYLYFGKGYHKFRELLSYAYNKHCEVIGNNIINFPDTAILSAIKGAMAEYDLGGGEPIAGTRYDFLTKARLFQSCQVAFKHFYEEKKLGQIEVVGIEVPINFTYSDGRRKSGRCDELVLWNKGLWLRDFKCSAKDPKYYPKSLKIKDQAYTYITGMNKVSGGQTIKGILYEQMYNDKPLKSGDNGKKGPAIHTHIVQYTPSQLKNWEFEQSFVHQSIDLARELDIYPMAENDMRCHWCDYYDVCDSLNENQMTGMLKNNFKIHIWDNMNPSDEE